MKKTLVAFSLISLPFVFANSFTDNRDGQKYPEGKSSSPLRRVEARADFDRMPLYFIPNQGQVKKNVDYYLQGRDKTIYFTSEGLTISLSAQKSTEAGTSQLAPGLRSEQKREDPNQSWAVKLNFLGADPAVHPAGEERTRAVVSYFRGKQEEWKAGLPTYSRVVYKDLWPGIDLVYSGVANSLKYEFVVRPGADPSKVRLAYRGATSVEITPDGGLEIRTPAGGFRDGVPLAYQELNGKNQKIDISYRLEETANGKEASSAEAGPDNGRPFIYGFEIGSYDQTKTLILDPIVLIYCGYIGGMGDDYGYAIALDQAWHNPYTEPDACAYIAGSTDSDPWTFPEKIGPYLTSSSGDAFVAKVDLYGAGLVYCGYVGGNGVEAAYSIAVDSYGNAYIGGFTSSWDDFPVTIGPDLSPYSLFGNGFVAKVNSSGTNLVYCGYVGEGYESQVNGIAVDSLGNAYVAGTAEHETYPINPLPGVISWGETGGSADAFVAKINDTGSGFVYYGMLGGAWEDKAYGIAVDQEGNAYVAGRTTSSESSFPVRIGPDLTFNSWGIDEPLAGDAFVAKVNSSGSDLVYCGYVGGVEDDGANGIALFQTYPDAYAFVTGFTASDEFSFPVIRGPDLTYNGDPQDAFVARINVSGSAVDFCGYIGGSGSDLGSAIGLDWRAYPYVAGSTNSSETTFPLVDGPDLTWNGGWDGFVAKVSSVGQDLEYCGYIGGASHDYARGIAVRKVTDYGVPYVVGHTSSTELSFPVVLGPDLTYNGGDCDAFVAKVAPAMVTISGQVTALPGGEPVEGVEMSGLPGDTRTNPNGEYSAQVVYNWGGTVTPMKPGYFFTPTSRSYDHVISNAAGQDYQATPLSYTISGYVRTESGFPVQGVSISFLDNGGTAMTDLNGHYSISMGHGWSGTAIPEKTGYSFSPPSRFYPAIESDQADQDYTALPPYAQPTVTTAPVTEVTSIRAKSGGNVISSGGAAVTERGVCWSTSSGPTIADSHTHDGTGLGSFVSSLTGLSANTPYFVRAYATNSAGTAYGSEIAFVTATGEITFATPAQNLSHSPASSSKFPKIVAVSGASYVCAIWVESSGDSDSLYFAKSSDEGATWTPPLALSSMSGQILGRSDDLDDGYAIAMDVENPYVHVVMQKRDSPSDDFEIYYRTSTDLGGSWGSWIQLTSNSADTRHPDVAARLENVHITYQDSGPGNNEVMYKRIASGVVDLTRRLTSSSGDSCFPRVAVSKNGDTVHVAYQDNYSGQAQVYYKHLDGAGAGSFTTRQLTSGAFWSGRPDIATSTGIDDQYVYIVYQALWPGNREIMYKRLGSHGHPGGSYDTARLTYSASESRASSIAFDRETNAVDITYHDNWPGNYDVMFRRLVDYGGAALAGKRVSWGTGDSSHATVGQSGGSVYVLWSDNSAGNYEVLFRKGS